MFTLEILQEITLVTSTLGIIISVISWFKIKKISIYIPYVLLTLFYILISAFEPNDSPPYVDYTDTFYCFEIITSLILIIGIFYQQSNIKIKTSVENRYFRLFLLLLVAAFLICIDGIIPASALILINISILIILIDNRYRVICQIIFKKFQFLEIILFLAFVLYLVSGNLIETIGYLLVSSNNASEIFNYRTAGYNENTKTIIVNILEFFCLSLMPFFAIYYLLIFLDIKKNQNFVRAVIFVFIGAIVSFSTLGKARISYYIAGIMLAISFHYLSFRRKSPFNILIILFPLLIGFLVIQLMYYLTGYVNEQEGFSMQFLLRLIQVPVQSNAAYFELFPSYEQFQLIKNTFTNSFIVYPLREFFTIDISNKPIEAITSYKLTGVYFGYVSSGFATAYAQWGLFSPVVTVLFVITTIHIDGILHLIHLQRKVYSVYSYVIIMMPVTVTTSYNSTVGLFGMWLLPLVFIFLYFLEFSSKKKMY